MLIPIILSGGVGARLWPVSRESHPKAGKESLLLPALTPAFIFLICRMTSYPSFRHEVAATGRFLGALHGLTRPRFFLKYL
ncbi:sugar phosphate nucleotidyltransferase [Sulfuricella sp.]|uniref:sugar phosphate nucleotidyltransferase n=1 Tax=Sulfuricella sp. TaxID=2099377 RepID=UPI0032C21798